ncbi:S-layer homology domain-containing protein [Paenibacillus sp. PDC88]|uniref:S-layer homology domain-containing protein n=1 Tax=Paenibacillus sp. PDC88 TaxID=1884375 RepID=UPI0008974185|nr:S-layer homology domain-containing protein [Paenibacillus sp. PDC88]SDW83575.1 S-layer homology domain-containing protein [Paenibacillus sp. PDC88]
MSKKVRGTVTGLLSISMALSSLGTVGAAQLGKDLEGHWAESQLQSWINQGNLNGYADGTVKPNQSISRAEFVSLINRSFGYSAQAPISFEDLSVSNWAYTDIAKAVEAGYVQGYEDNTFRPGTTVTRQEAAVMISKLLNVKSNDYNTLNQFSDRNSIAGWSKAAVASVVEREVMKGYPNDTFAPLRSLTRAEAIVLIDNAIANEKELNTITYDEAGTYGSDEEKTVIEGNVIISVPDVTLVNTEIKGDLLFAEGIGAGDVTIKNVKVYGTTNVEGGGENSIHLVDSVLINIVVNKKDGTVRIVAEGSTSAQNVIVNSSVKLEEENASGVGFTDVELSRELPSNSTVVLNGIFDDVDLYAASISVELVRGSIENFLVSEDADGNEITLSSNTRIAQLVLGAMTQLLGSGTISKATLNEGAQGSSFETKPSQLDGVQKDNVILPPSTTPPVSSGGSGGGGNSGNNPDPVPAQVDKSALFVALNIARDLIEDVPVGTEPGQINQDSKNALISAVAFADVVYLNANATQAQVNQSHADLVAAIEAFNAAIITDSTEEGLQAAKLELGLTINNAKSLNEAVYVGEEVGQVSVQAKIDFTEAIRVAEAVYADITVSVAEVNLANRNLDNAVQTFQSAINKEDQDGSDELENAKQQLYVRIVEADQLYVNTSVGEEVGQVSQAAKENLDAAITVAKSVYSNQTDINVVNVATSSLNEAISSFNAAIITDEQVESEAVKAAKAVLYSEIKRATVIADTYVVGDQIGQVPAEQKEALDEQISVAKSVYSNVEISSQAVYTAISDLQLAVSILESSVIEVVSVTTLSELSEAVTINNNKIKLEANLVGQQSVAITGENVQIDGYGFTLQITGKGNRFTVENDGASVSNLTIKDSAEYNLQVYNANNVIIEDVILQNSLKGGLLINGSEVTANNVTTSGNAWGGIEVSKGAGEGLKASTLTVKGTSSHDEAVAIWTVNPTGEGNQVIDASEQYRSYADVRPDKQGYTNYILKDAYQVVSSLAEFKQAVTIDNNKVQLWADLSGEESVAVTGENVELDGNDFTLEITGKGNRFTVENDDVSISNLTIQGSTEYNLQVYNANNVNINDVILQNSLKGGLLVNGSEVTVNNIKTIGNDWGGIEVSKGAGEGLKASTLTVKGTSSHDEAVAIWTVNPAGEANQVIDASEQYRSYTDVRPDKQGYTNYILSEAYQVVNSLAEFKQAVTIDNNKVQLGADLAGEESVAVTGENVQIDGDGYTLEITGEGNRFTVENDGVSVSNLTIQGSTEYNLQVYNANNVNIEDVILQDSLKGGLLINGSEVTVSNVTTSGNAWGGIEVSKGAGESLQASTLTVKGTSSHDEAVAIWTVNPSGEGNQVIDASEQYRSYADVRPDKQGYTNYILKDAHQVVNSFQELSAAVKGDGNKIKLGKSITETGVVLEVTGQNVIIEGANHTLSLTEAGNSFVIFGNGTQLKNLTVAGSQKYNIHVYKATGVALENVNLTTALNGGMLVNGAEVSVHNIETSDNAWGGIEVSRGTNVESQPTLTVEGISHHNEEVAIWTDPKNGSAPTIKDVSNQYRVEDITAPGKEGFKYYYFEPTAVN